MKYNKLSLEWLEYIKPLIKESTYANYEFIVIRHINPYFKNRKVNTLCTNDLQEFVNHKFIKGRLDNKGGLHPKSIEDILMVLNQTIDYAFINQYLDSFNKRVKIPKLDTIMTKKTFNNHDIDRLITYLSSNINNKNIALLISIYTGVRAGELSALKWNDIDLDNKTITINKTVQRIYSIKDKTKVIQTSPKSKKANRSIPINLNLLSTLEENYGGSNNYIVTNNTKTLEPRSLRYYYTQVLELLEIEYLPFHSIRHSFATRLIYKTGDYKIVSELLGHSSVSITLDTYAHSDMRKKDQCINQF